MSSEPYILLFKAISKYALKMHFFFSWDTFLHFQSGYYLIPNMLTYVGSVATFTINKHVSLQNKMILDFLKHFF